MFDHVFETMTAGVAIQAPQLDINTVAAGGGSRLWYRSVQIQIQNAFSTYVSRSGMFVVGPESVGAHPGPVCYRKGGKLAITDANLLLGRVFPEYFPKIFGKNADEALDIEATTAEFKSLTDGIPQTPLMKQTINAFPSFSLSF